MRGITKVAALSSSILIALLLGIANPSEGQEVLSYRLLKQKSMHLDNAKVAQQYENTLRTLGCKVQKKGHEGHFDLIYSCPKWEIAQFTEHQSAHKWERWLQSLGFEVDHQHD